MPRKSWQDKTVEAESVSVGRSIFSKKLVLYFQEKHTKISYTAIISFEQAKKLVQLLQKELERGQS